MKMKTIFALLTVLAMLACMAGCGASGSAESAAPTGTTTQIGTGRETPSETDRDIQPAAGPQGQTEASPEINGGTLPESSGEAELRSTEAMGRVTAIDGVRVSFEIFRMNQGFGELPAGENGQQPPELPSGENGQPSPEMPMGDNGPGGRAPGRGGMGAGRGPVGAMESLTLEVDAETAASLSVGDAVLLRFDASGQLSGLERFDPQQLGGMGRGGRDGNGGFPGGQGGFSGGQGGFPGGQGGFPGGQGDFPNGQGGSASHGGGTSGNAANTAETDLSGETLVSSAADENALRVSGASVTLTDLTVQKTGDSSDTESSDFYGINAGLLAADGADVTVVGGSFTTDGAGANAVFSYGSGTSLTIRDAVIRTASRNSGGIQTAGGAATTAENLDVETEGASAAAIRSDRGGGTVRVTGGTFTTRGTGSPAIYSTADISVSDAVLTAESSEAVVVEGKNSVTLENCAVTGSMTGTYGADSGENLHGVMIYQSMSGDAGVGKGSFSMRGGSLTTRSGDLFYVTNTKAEIDLTGVDLHPANGVLLRVSGNDGRRGWGTAGSNGGSVTMTAKDQVLTGEILVDEISSLDLTLSGDTVWTGTVNPSGEGGQVRLTLEAGASWSLTGDAELSAFSGDLSAVETNGFTLRIGGEIVKN